MAGRKKDEDPLVRELATLRERIAELERGKAQTKRVEEVLQRERNLLGTLIDYLPDYVYVKDAQSRFVAANAATARIMGAASPSDLLGKTDADFYPKELATEYLHDEQEVLRRGEPVVNKDEPGMNPDGSPRAILTTKVPLKDSEGKVVGLVGIGRDITERKRAEEALQRAHDELERRVEARTAELARANADLARSKEAAEAASRAKSAFLASMSHEIRTPLNAIIGMTELVLKSRLSAQQRDFISTVKDSGEALLSVVSDILDFSKIEAGRLVLDCRPFDLRQSLGNTVKSFDIRARQQGLGLSCRIHRDVPRMVVGDYGRLRQIVVNLLGNAIKFTERGEVALEVSQSSRGPEEVVLQFTVSDTGIGIPEEKQSLVFEMFEQVDSSLARRHGGTGLGLAIASRLVDLMEGRIWLESEVGRGSRFHFTARLGLAAPGSAVPESPEPARSHGMRVLVVEDSLVNQKVALALLEGAGHVVTVTNNGRDAVDRVKSGQFDLVLMDVQMPEMDGLEATTRIREWEKQTGAHMAIVAMTAHALTEDRERCLAAGMDGYIAKPIRPEELFRAVDTVCEATVPSMHQTAAAQAEIDDWPEAVRAAQGNPQLVRIMAEAVIEQVPHLIAQIDQAIDVGDANVVQLSAHTLKGSLRYFGKGTALEQICRLEKMGKTRDLAEAADSLAILEPEVARILGSLREYVKNRRG